MEGKQWPGHAAPFPFGKERTLRHKKTATFQGRFFGHFSYCHSINPTT